MACGKDFEITKTWTERGKEITSTVTARCTEGDFVTRLCPECSLNLKKESQDES